MTHKAGQSHGAGDKYLPDLVEILASEYIPNSMFQRVGRRKITDGLSLFDKTKGNLLAQKSQQEILMGRAPLGSWPLVFPKLGKW